MVELPRDFRRPRCCCCCSFSFVLAVLHLLLLHLDTECTNFLEELCLEMEQNTEERIFFFFKAAFSVKREFFFLSKAQSEDPHSSKDAKSNH